MSGRFRGDHRGSKHFRNTPKCSGQSENSLSPLDEMSPFLLDRNVPFIAMLNPIPSGTIALLAAEPAACPELHFPRSLGGTFRLNCLRATTGRQARKSRRVPESRERPEAQALDLPRRG